MQKGFSVVLIIVVLLALVGGAYYFMQSNSSQETTNSTSSADSSDEMSQTEKQMTGNDTESFIGSFTDLLKLGRNITCTFDTRDDSGNETKGTVYISGEKMRGTFQLSQVDGTQMDADVLQDGEYNYFWSPQQPQGTKLKIAELENDEVDTPDKKSPADFSDDEFDYSCQPWVVNSSIFTPPSTVQFVDITSNVQQIDDVMQQAGEDKCAVCNQAPAGTAREQCLQALGCN